jgi:hypothetical protein
MHRASQRHGARITAERQCQGYDYCLDGDETTRWWIPTGIVSPLVEGATFNQRDRAFSTCEKKKKKARAGCFGADAKSRTRLTECLCPVGSVGQLLGEEEEEEEKEALRPFGQVSTRRGLNEWLRRLSQLPRAV